MNGVVSYDRKGHFYLKSTVNLTVRKSTLVQTGVKFSSVNAYMKFVTNYGMIMSFSLVCEN